MKSFFSKNKKKIIAISLSVFLLAIFFFFPSICFAQADKSIPGGGVAKVVGWIIFPFVWIMGKLAVILLGILVKVAQYNDFIGSAAVTYGWVVVRDLCNMFFVLILLIIAFASILRIDSYNLKTWLPKLVIMAVLINFSKLICGIFIDFAQVIMLTFVNAFKDIAGANLTEMLGITKMLDFDQGTTGDVTAWSIVGSMILALIFSVISVVVILTMLVMLAMRIIYLWVYIVLSPLAYLTAAFPQGRSKSERWWTEFSQYVVVGPVLAFFIWLAFVSLGGVAGSDEMKNFGVEKTSNVLNEADSSVPAGNVALTEAGSEENMIKFIISVGMLLGGLMLAQEMGGKVGAIAGKGMAKLQTMGAGSLKVGKNIGTWGAKRTAEAGLNVGGKFANQFSKDPTKGNQIGNFAAGWSKDMKKTRTNNAVKARREIMESMGMGEQAGAAGKTLTGTIKTALNVGDKKGNKNIKDGSEQIKEGNKDLNLANNLKNSQNKWHALEADLIAMPANDPGRADKQREFNDETNNLENLKIEAGLNRYADDATTAARVSDLETTGQAKVDAGTTLVDTGNKQKGGYGKFGTFLIGNTNKAFAEMSKDYERADNFTEALANDDPVFSDVDGGKFSKLDSSIGTEQKAVWGNLNSNKHAGAATKLKNLTENVLFDSAGNAKTLKDADKAKVNSMARGLKTYESSGAKLSPELTALKKLINDYAAKSGGTIKSVDERKAGSYRISGNDKPSNNMDVNESGIGSINEFGRNRGKSDTISYNFDKLAAKGLNVDTMAEGVHLEGDIKDKVKIEIISDIDKELNDLKAKVSGGQETSVKDSNRMKILETAKTRLESGDDFSLVNANKKMGLTEAVITQRHEGAHAKLDEMRKTENFHQTQEQEKQEEELVEFYGNRARDAKVTHQATDMVVADVIFEGQKRGLSTDEIKVNISEITDEYKAGRQKTPNKIEDVKKEVRESVQVNNIIKNETEAIKGDELNDKTPFSMPDMSESFGNLGENIKDSFSKVKGSVNELKKTSDSIKMAQDLQERIDLYRYQQLKKNKK